MAHSRQDTIGTAPHLQGLFYRRGRLVRQGDGCFWLSDTPDIPGSVSFPQDWGARSCVWARLRDDRSGRDLLFAVTHLDTNGGAWTPSVRVLAAQLARRAGETPVVLVGDFNCAGGSEAWRLLTGEGGFTDAWTAAGHADEGVTTFNAFMPVNRLPLDDLPRLEQWMHDTCDAVPQFAHYPAHVLAHRNYRIDWILFRGPFTARTAAVITDTPGGRPPSDHWPITATLAWPG
ncbi:MAG: endonuclease/exonuclease/phosphatase family protein [bacterium]